MEYNSVWDALEGVQFPISKSDLLSQIGYREVRISVAKSLRMSDLLSPCEYAYFNSARDVIDCPQIMYKLTGYENLR